MGGQAKRLLAAKSLWVNRAIMPLATAPTTLDIGPFQGHVAWEMRLLFFCFPLQLSRIRISYLAATMSKTELWCSFLSVGSYFDEQISNFNMNYKAPAIAVTSGLLLLSLPGTVPRELQLLLCSIGNDSQVRSCILWLLIVSGNT